MIVAAFWAKKKKIPLGKRSTISQVLRTFLNALPSLFLLFIVIGGIVSGVFTATEASAIAVLYCLVLGLIYREIKWNNLPQILLESSVTSAVVMLLIASSMSMSWVMSFQNIPKN